MTSTQPVNQPMTKVWRPQGFAGVELWRVERSCQPFPKHIVQNHHLSVITNGAGYMDYRGERYPLPQRLYHYNRAGEPVTASPVDQWSGRVIEISEPLVETMLAEVGAKRSSPIDFPQHSLSNDTLNRELSRLHLSTFRSFATPMSHLGREESLLNYVHMVLKHCSDTPPPENRLGREHRAVTLVKEVLRMHPERDNTLDELATLTSLNKHYLYRVFCRDVGLSPHKYQASVRVHRAKDLLAAGVSIAQASLETGFTDQSHLTHVFKKYTQVTPGQFQRDSSGNERFRELSG